MANRGILSRILNAGGNGNGNVHDRLRLSQERDRVQRATPMRVRMVRGSFDAAQTTNWNKAHWANADALSPNAAVSSAVRKTVRERARYEVANNTYARGIVNTLANWTIGYGPRLQLLPTDDSTGLNESAQRIEARFAEWAEAVNLARKLWTARVSKAVDGESFAQLVTNTLLPCEVKLDLRLFECDLCSTPNFTTYALKKNVTDGIVYDEACNQPVEYHILRNHPGNDYGGSLLDFDRVPARHIIHLFRADRPGQFRGVSELMAALPLFAQLRRYTVAVLGAAESAADWAIILKTNAAANEEADALEALDEIELTPRMMTTAPFGWEPVQMRAEQPSTGYGDFKHEILNEIGRVLDVPYNIAAMNSKEYNMASGRLDHQSFFRNVQLEQRGIERDAMNARILPAWMREDRLLHPEDYPGSVAYRSTWYWAPGYVHVDPQKDANAQDTRLKNDSTTYAREYASSGCDYEAEFRQGHRERMLKLELNVELAKKRKQLLAGAGITDADLDKVLPKDAPQPAAATVLDEEDIRDATQ